MPRRTYKTFEVEESLKALRLFHLAGQTSRVAFPRTYNRLKEMTAAAGLTAEQLNKARAFAAKMTTDQVEAICELARRHQTPFGPVHITFTMPLPDAARDRVIERALRNGWGANQLMREVKKQRPAPDLHKGRLPQLPKDAAGYLVFLRDTALTWRRWRRALDDPRRATSKAAFAKLPADVKRLVNQVVELMAELEEGVEKARQKP